MAMTPCPHCGRRFNAAAATRHITLCGKKHQHSAAPSEVEHEPAPSHRGPPAPSAHAPPPPRLVAPPAATAHDDAPIRPPGGLHGPHATTAAASPPRTLAEVGLPELPAAAAYDPSVEASRVECANCGRKFGPDSIDKHQRICVKSAKNAAKRGTFDAKAMRADGTELNDFVPPPSSEKAAKGGAGRKNHGLTDDAAAAAKKEKWKAQSEAFRNAMRAAREYDEAVKAGKPPPPPPAPVEEADDRVPCPHCGRKFNDVAAARHVPHCAQSHALKAPPAAHRGHSPASAGGGPHGHPHGNGAVAAGARKKRVI